MAMQLLPIAASPTPRRTFLPEALRAFLVRRLWELAGLALIAMATITLMALVSYDTGDPSFNQATARAAVNLLGGPGAVVADTALQWTGLAAAVPALALFAWGLRVMVQAHWRVTRWRLVALPAGVALASAALAIVPAPAAWPFSGGLGGALGALWLDWAPRLGSALHINVGLIFGVIVGWALLVNGYVATASWRGAIAAARRTAPAVGWTVRCSVDTATGLARHVATRRQRQRAEPRIAAGPAATKPQSAAQQPREPLVATRPGHSGAGHSERSGAEPSRVERSRARAAPARQARLDLHVPGEPAELPPLELLAEPAAPVRGDRYVSEEALAQNARMLAAVLEDFGVRGEIVKVRPGPVVTLYELEPAPGTKTSRVIGLADDIARSMSAVSVRIAVVPGRNVIGIELPNDRRETVSLRELLAATDFERGQRGLRLALGKDIGGAPVVADLARMPHLLIAGTTGSGKSVGINAMILSLLYQLPPEVCRFIMIDPKMLELSVYDGIPHLLAPVVTDPKKAIVALKWAVREMENRYRAMSKLGVRNISGYNQRLALAQKKGESLKRMVQTGFDTETGKPVFEEQPLDMTPLPFIVVVVDEMADLMLVAGKDVEAAIQRLSQMARAAGIHLIMATQRPSVDVVTGTIKANFPTRVSFQVTTKIDSRTILGEQGAEQLLGMGDMLYMAGGGRVTRVHGPFVSDREVEAVVAFLRAQGEPDYVDEVTEDEDVAAGIPGFETAGSDGESLYDQAVALVAREGKASTSFVQRHLQIGYNRAARIIEQMEKEGVVSGANHVGKREVLVGDHSARR